MTKLIIAGSRNIDKDVTLQILRQHLFRHSVPTEIVSGAARGVDTWGEEFAKTIGVPVTRFPADWDKYGKSAGYRRNVEMSRYADALFAIWDGESRGTKHMIDIMRHAEKSVYVVGYFKIKDIEKYTGQTFDMITLDELYND